MTLKKPTTSESTPAPTEAAQSDTPSPAPAQPGAASTRPSTPAKPEATKRLTAKEMFDARKAEVSSKTHSALNDVMKSIEATRGGVDTAKATDYVGEKSGLKRSNPEKWAEEAPKVKKALDWAVLSQTAEAKDFEQFRAAAVDQAAEDGGKLGSSKFMAKMKKKVEELFGKGKWLGFIGALFAMLKWDPHKGKGKFIASLIGYKPPPKEKTTPSPDENAKKTAEKAAKVKKYVDLFGKHSPKLKLDESTVITDIATLSSGGIAETDIEKNFKEAFGSGGRLKLLNDNIAKATDNKPFTYRLTDLLFQRMPQDNIDKIYALWRNPKNSIPKTPEGIRTFMDALHTDFNKAIADYSKPAESAVAATTPKPAEKPDAKPTKPAKKT